MGAERRMAERKIVDSIQVADITTLRRLQRFGKPGFHRGCFHLKFLLHLNREDLVPEDLRST